MLKVMTIVGTRPEIIKLSRVIAELKKYTNHVLVHTGQNYDYELNQVFFDEMKIGKPDWYLEAAGDTPAETIGNVIARADEVMARFGPDALLVYGDTNSCLSVIPAKRRKIPVFHLEAGNRCFDQRVPEEINRKIVDHLSDINMPITEHARRYLLSEGLRPETVIKTGSCMKEVLDYYRAKISSSDVLDRLELVEDEYFVVSAHREENVDNSELLAGLVETLNAVAGEFDKRIIFSVHPRTRDRLQKTGSLKLDDSVEILNPLGFLDYVRLEMGAFCVLSDSGTITEESSLLGFPAITIRQAHERPEGMDEGTLIMSGLNPARVVDSIRVVTEQSRSSPRMRVVQDYDVDAVSKKVVRIILSYTDYVNRTIWRKHL